MKKYKVKKFATVTPTSVEKSDVRLGIEIQITDYNTITLEIDNSFSDDMKKHAIDKSFELLKEINIPFIYGDRLYATFNPDENQWDVINVREELIKKARKDNKI